MGFKAAVSDWSEDNPLGAKILEQQCEIARLQAGLSESNFERDNNRAKLEVAKYHRDTAWNDAVEAAACEVDCEGCRGSCMDPANCHKVMAQDIRALKRT